LGRQQDLQRRVLLGRRVLTAAVRGIQPGFLKKKPR
jgi:hypothetical protein